jgi:hypothetical protein
VTDKEAMNFYEEMEQFFGELPNFEHHPRQFAHCVKVYKYYKARNEQKDSPQVSVQQ